VRLKWLIPTILNYGNLEIQTTDRDQSSHSKKFQNPIKAKELIIKARDTFIYERPDNLETHGNI